MKLIPLTRGAFAVVDDDDLALVSGFNWCVTNTAEAMYASTVRDGHKIYMHRLVSGAPDNMVVDHVSGITLDNRRGNLRVCTQGQNVRNQKKNQLKRGGVGKYKGVRKSTWLCAGDRKTSFYASLMLDGATIRSGPYETEEEAARAYDASARQHFGSFARLNFPRVGEQPALPPDREDQSRNGGSFYVGQRSQNSVQA